MSRFHNRGFTLVEVMVALVIVALSVPALLFTLDQQIDGTAYLRDRALAQVVAANRLSELRLAARAGRPTLQGATSGREDMLGRRWYWRVQSEATEVPGFRRVEVRVHDADDSNTAALATLVGFLADADASQNAGG